MLFMPTSKTNRCIACYCFIAAVIINSYSAAAFHVNSPIIASNLHSTRKQIHTSLTLSSNDNIDDEPRDNGVKLGIGSFATTTIAALALFFSVDQAAITAYQSGSDIMQANGLSVVANAADQKQQKDIPPPPITATSTERSLLLGEDLKSLDARIFGAYWCSHCYEQKQTLGKEAMRNVGYVECSKEGLNSASEMCKEKNIPGYPTWEIGGKLFPGEMYLDELEDIVKNFKK